MQFFIVPLQLSSWLSSPFARWTPRLTVLRLHQVESLYTRLCPDADKMTQLMVLGFSEREARLGLRACHGDVHEAAMLISNQRQVTWSPGAAARLLIQVHNI